MPLNLDAFRNVANTAWVTSRDIVVHGEGDNAVAKLGNYIFSQGSKANDATMAAFKTALEKEYGVFGTHAFDTYVGTRSQLHQSLRAADVKKVLSHLNVVKGVRVVGEVMRQFDTSPKMLQLSDGMRESVRYALNMDKLGGVDLSGIKNEADVVKAASERIDRAIDEAKKDAGKVDTSTHDIDGAVGTGASAKPNEPTGLKNLSLSFKSAYTSIEDRIKRGSLGVGMSVNRSADSRVVLEKLKTNGVEPGFIYRNDWTENDTRSYMATIPPDADRAAILREGRASKFGMAAAAELIIEKALSHTHSGIKVPDKVRDLGEAIFEKYPLNAVENLFSPEKAAVLKEIKTEFFTQIRDAVMSVGPKNADGTDSELYKMSPVFKHFNDRGIVKLDYNEGDRIFTKEAAHAGSFMRPERIKNRTLGQIYRLQTASSADSISAGAVTEALANDLTRVAGVPAQELQIVRGQYSDGHPKLMLAAKFAEGYKDMEDGMIKDGRAVPPTNKDGSKGPDPEPLGRFKAFFLVTADRDAVGRRGQNKGFVNGKFFAIDPGHSLEGNGKYLEISDDLSFKDTYGSSTKPRFENFSVFDDDTRAAKFKGVLEMRELQKSGAFKNVFNDYRKAFDPNEGGISDAEKALRVKICAEIDTKEAEFNQQLARLMKVFDPQLRLHDDLAARGPAVQEKAVNTISHLEMLTSPTTWVSKKGEVALKHLEVRPETRVPWRAEVVGDDIVYHCDKPMDGSTVKLLETLAANAGVKYEYDNWGNSRLVVPQGAAEKFFAVFSEENVQKLTHPEEYQARMDGLDSLKVAKDYKPVAYVNVPNPNPPIKSSDLPEQLDIRVDGRVVKLPKVHYERLATTLSSVSRPRSVDELRASLEARIRRGNDILRALRDGNTELFEPTRDNVVAVTHALHAAALRKGEFMYRGSFSVADPDGNIARWLDRAENLYLRTSTHAKPFHSVNVDGHLNMPRGLDIPEGMGGLLNGMRTFHFFTIPDPDGLATNGGSGPKRRLFLKCETFGIYCSTANFHPFDKADAKSEGMQTRSYRPGDFIESIFHGASLLRSFGTDKEADGIRKENLLEATKEVIEVAEANLRGIGEDALADLLVLNVTGKGAGVRQLMDNLAAVVENLPADENKRAEVTDILEDLLAGIERTAGHLTGNISHRMGNEIMID